MLSQRPGDDIARVGGQLVRSRHVAERLLGVGAGALLESTPGAEADEQAGGGLRIAPVELEDEVREERVTVPVGTVELGLVAAREGADQRADAVRIGGAERRMLLQAPDVVE